jgi:excisionase family DNA binding protein
MAKKKATPLEDWITIAQAAAMLGIVKSHAHRLVRAGEIEARFIAGRWFVNPDSVAAWTRKRAPNKPKDKPIE